MVAPTLGMMITLMTTGTISTRMSLDPPFPPPYSFAQLRFFAFFALLLFLITVFPTRSVLNTLLECPFGVVVYLYLLNKSNHVWWLHLLRFVYHVWWLCLLRFVYHVWWFWFGQQMVVLNFYMLVVNLYLENYIFKYFFIFSKFPTEWCISVEKFRRNDHFSSEISDGYTSLRRGLRQFEEINTGYTDGRVRR